jgi:hypothetical protein
MQFLTIILLGVIFLMVGAGSTATIVLMKNVSKDALKVAQIGETQLHQSLLKHSVKDYRVHND